jgi:hypothetical protein
VRSPRRITGVRPGNLSLHRARRQGHLPAKCPAPRRARSARSTSTPANTTVDSRQREELPEKGDEAGRKLEARGRGRRKRSAQRRAEQRAREEQREREAQEREERARSTAAPYWRSGDSRGPCRRPPPRPVPRAHARPRGRSPIRQSICRTRAG